MNSSSKLEKPRVPKRFYLLTLLIYLPVFYCLTVIQARWYGYALAVATFAALLWIRRSAAWHGWHIPLCFALAFVTAFLGLYFSRPRWDVSLPGQIGSGTLRVFVRLPVDQSVKSGETFGEISAWKAADGYSFSRVQLTDCSMEVLKKDDSGSDYAILQFHGGAFVSGLNDLYRMMAERYCDMANGASVFTLDYRLAPGHPYPAQQEDAMDAWVYLTQTLGYDPGRVILTGDSAGGNLVLSLCLRLRDQGRPLPAALIALSPWADLGNTGPSHIENATVDPTFGLDKKDFDGITPVGVETTYPDKLDVRDPYLSPSFGDYHGFPPMLLQAGELEVLLSDSEMIEQNARKNGVLCTLTVYPGMFHVFQGSLDLLPESRDAWTEIAAFISDMQGRQ